MEIDVRRRIVDLLLELEWCGNFNDAGASCPQCFRYWSSEEVHESLVGHERDCELANLLEELGVAARVRQP